MSYSPGRTGGGGGSGTGDPVGSAAAAQAYAVQRANHTGTQTADTVVDGTTNKAYSATEKTKLASVASGATANADDATLLNRANHTGTESADVLIDGTTKVAYLATERTKLSGVAAGATVNSPDATLLARGNHTGTQSADSLVDGTTNKAYTATEKTKLAGVASGATANAPDATLEARANHTGTQTADTIVDGTTNKAYSATEKTKLAGVAAGATQNSPDATLLNRANHTGLTPAAAVSGLAAVATSGAYADLTGSPTATPVATVTYSGSLTTARPSATLVVWENFPSQPTNMADGDLWLSPPDPVFDRSVVYGPTGTVRANFDRSTCSMGQTVAMTMGTLSLTLIYLYAGDTFSNINVRAGTGGWTGITHSWAVLSDINLNPLAVSSDVTTATQAAQTTRTFPIVGAPYIVPTSGLYYVGVMAAGTTAPVVGPNAFSIGQQNIAPLSGGTSNTGQTTPPSVGGAALTALTVVANPIPYLWLT